MTKQVNVYEAKTHFSNLNNLNMGAGREEGHHRQSRQAGGPSGTGGRTARQAGSGERQGEDHRGGGFRCASAGGCLGGVSGMWVLLDTHVILWWITGVPQLSLRAREIMGAAPMPDCTVRAFPGRGDPNHFSPFQTHHPVPQGGCLLQVMGDQDEGDGPAPLQGL